MRKGKSIGESYTETGFDENIESKDILPAEIFYFQKKIRKGGTIDVWWLYDDGGEFYWVSSKITFYLLTFLYFQAGLAK